MSCEEFAGAAATIKMWTLGREREKRHVAPRLRDSRQRRLLFDVIDAVHALKEGVADAGSFVGAARAALTDGDSVVVDETGAWLAKVAGAVPAVGGLWDELAVHPSWKVRWHVAGRLYWYIPEDRSDCLFAVLRGDRSKKVREMAVSRYEYRTDEERTFVKMFDADRFDDRVRSGEIRLPRASERG